MSNSAPDTNCRIPRELLFELWTSLEPQKSQNSGITCLIWIISSYPALFRDPAREIETLERTSVLDAQSAKVIQFRVPNEGSRIEIKSASSHARASARPH